MKEQLKKIFNNDLALAKAEGIVIGLGIAIIILGIKTVIK